MVIFPQRGLEVFVINNYSNSAKKMAASRVLGRMPCFLYREFKNGLIDYERAWR